MMKKIKYSFGTHLAMLITCLCLVVACKTDPKTTADKKESSSKTGAAKIVTDEDLKVTIQVRSEPKRLNPVLTTTSTALQLLAHLFPTLLNFSPEDLSVQPVLVKSLPTVAKLTEGPYAGGVSYSYEIHEEAVWDNGLPVTGHDYVLGMKILFNPLVKADAYRGVMNFVKAVKVDATNPKKFVVYSDQTYIMGEAYSGFFMYPAYAYDPQGLMKDIPLTDLTDPEKAAALAKSNANLKTFADAFNSPEYGRELANITSCGAYKLVEWIPNQRLVLRKKENWWGDKLVKDYPMLTAIPKELVYEVIRDGNSALTQLKSGALDVAVTSTNDYLALQENEQAKKNLNFYKPESMSYVYIALNAKNPKLKDKKVRQAIAHAVDRDEIIEVLKSGLARTITGPIPSQFDYYNKSLKPIPYNVEKAKTLLAGAGWKDTNGNGIVDKQMDGELVELTIEFAIPTSKASEQLAILVKETAKRAGIDIEIKVKETSVYLADRRRREFEMMPLQARPDPGLYDPYQLWHSKSDTPSGGNFVGFRNMEADKLIEEIRVTLDKKKRDALYLQLQEIIYDEQPAIFLYSGQTCIVANQRLNLKTSVYKPGYFEQYSTVK
ncbi:MAG: ABC transporter substrate-binding protein [Saprospiraceae bacterium]